MIRCLLSPSTSLDTKFGQKKNNNMQLINDINCELEFVDNFFAVGIVDSIVRDNLNQSTTDTAIPNCEPKNIVLITCPMSMVPSSSIIFWLIEVLITQTMVTIKSCKLLAIPTFALMASDEDIATHCDAMIRSMSILIGRRWNRWMARESSSAKSVKIKFDPIPWKELLEKCVKDIPMVRRIKKNPWLATGSVNREQLGKIIF